MATKKSGHGGSAGTRQILEDLRVHQIELERQNEELRRAQLELDAARARYFDLFDLAPAGYVTVSEEGLILEANLTAATLLGVARGELVRQRLSRFILKEDQDCYYLHRKRLFETGEPQAYELRMVKEDGTGFWAHLDAAAAQDSDGGPVCRVVMSDITERKRVEEALRQSEERYRSILNASPDGITITDLEGRVLMVSPVALTMFGCEREEQLLGHLMTDFIVPEDRDKATANVALMFTGVMTGPGEYRGLRADGSTFGMEVNGEFVRDADGRPASMVFVVRDITERKRVDEALRNSETRFGALVAQSPLSVQILDTTGKTIQVNRAFEVLWGTSFEQTQAFNPLEDEQLDGLGLRPYLKRAFSGESVECPPVEYTPKTRDGVGLRRVVQTIAYPIKDESGAVREVTLIHQDITERRRAEDELRRLASVVRYSSELVNLSTLDGKMIFLNEAGSRMLGISPAEVEHFNIMQAIPAHLKEKVETELLPALVGVGAWAGELQYLNLKTGQLTDVHATTFAVRDPATGAPLYLANVSRDITEWMRTDEALRESEERYRTLVESALDGIVIHVGDRVAFANHAAAAMLGFAAPAALVGQPLAGFVHPADLASAADRVRRVLAGEAVEYPVEVRYVRRDGTELPVENTGALVSYKGKPAILSVIRDITERKRAEEALRKSEARYRRITEGLTDYQYTVRVEDGHAVETMQTAACASVTGYTTEEYAADPYLWIQMVTPEDRERVREHARRILAGEDVPAIEHRIVRKDGAVRWVSDTAILLRDASGRLLSYDGVISDITGRKRTEQALHESEANFRTFFETIGDLIVVATPEGRILFTNQAFERKLGYSAAELTALHVLDVHPADKRREAEEIFAAMFRGEQESCPLPLAAKSGALIPVETRVWFGRWNGADCIFGVCKDLSAEQEAQQRFERLFRSNPALMALSTLPDRRFSDVNDAFLKTLGYSRGEIVGKTAAELGMFPRPEQQAEVGSKLQAAGRVADFELQVQRKDGVIIDGLFSGEVITSQGRQHFLTVMIDITERKRAEMALRLSEERHRHLVESSDDWVWETDANAVITFASARVTDLLGYAPEEVVGRLAYDLMPPEDAERARAAFGLRVAQRQAFRGVENTNLHKNGRRVVMESNGVPLFDASGAFRGYRGVDTDITERKLLQAEFVQSQKMESVGRLAGGIAHDFNNLLSVINGYAELAVADRSLSTPLRAQIVAIHRAGERAATLTRQLLSFSRRQTVEPVVLDLNDAVRAVQKMLERLIGEDVTLVFAPTEPLGCVRADPGQFEQVVMNLVINARDAMPAGGMLGIETANVELDREAAERVSVKPGSYVMLAVSDIGMGMDEVTREHIFEPFFTTKGSGKGTGLGLAIVYGIVQQFGGGIQVTSTVGQGTTFSLYLPRVETPVSEEAATPPAPAEEVGGTETILVVEDDESLRTMATDVLAAVGYTVLQARHGEEALQVLARHGEPVHLVFTDMVMPGMGGPELAKEIGKTHPQIRVLFTSGFASDATAGRTAPEELTHFICKPYSVGQLTRKVREVLDWLW